MNALVETASTYPSERWSLAQAMAWVAWRTVEAAAAFDGVLVRLLLDSPEVGLRLQPVAPALELSAANSIVKDALSRRKLFAEGFSLRTHQREMIDPEFWGAAILTPTSSDGSDVYIKLEGRGGIPYRSIDIASDKIKAEFPPPASKMAQQPPSHLPNVARREQTGRRPTPAQILFVQFAIETSGGDFPPGSLQEISRNFTEWVKDRYGPKTLQYRAVKNYAVSSIQRFRDGGFPQLVQKLGEKTQWPTQQTQR